MAEQFFHLNHRLRENQLKLIQEAQRARLEAELASVTDPAAYREDSIESLRRVVFDSYEKIAPMLNANIAIQNQRTKQSMVLQGATRGKFLGTRTDAVETKRNMYFDLTQSIIDAFSGATRSPKEMMLESVKANAQFSYAFNEHTRSSSTYNAAKRSMEYLRNNPHGVIAFDLETFGGVNQHGRQQVDKITEFSFLYYSDANASMDDATKTISGYVGITSKKEEAKYLALLNKFKENPTQLTKLEEITLRSFAKLGSGNLLVEPDEDEVGRYLVKGGGDERNVRLTAENVKKGIERSREIGIVQSQHLTKEGLMKWEKDLADAIVDMQTSKRSIMGHNLISADIPWLNQFMSGSRKEVQDYLTSRGGSISLDGIARHRIADTFPVMQHAMSNDRFRGQYLDERTRVQLAKYGLTPSTLEALSLRGMTDAEIEERMGTGINESHTSTYDAKQGFGILSKQVGNKNLIDFAIEAGGEMNESNVYGTVRGNSQQLFYAARAIGGSQDGIMGFRVDPFDGNYYTMDGYTVNPTKNQGSTDNTGNVRYNKGFNEWLTKKGMTYTVEDIVEVSAVDYSDSSSHLSRYIQEMKKANPALAVDELIAVKMKTISMYDSKPAVQGTGSETPKLETHSYFLGTKSNIQNMFNNNMIMYGEKNDKGEMKLKKNAEEILAGYRLVETGDGMAIREISSDNLIKDVIKSGNRAFIDDTASRQIREMDYDKYLAFSNFAMSIEEKAEALEGDNITAKRKIVLQNAIEEGKKLAEKIAKNGPLKAADQTDSLGVIFDILGYEDWEGNIKLHPGRVNNAVAMVDYFREMNPILQGVFATVNERSEKDNSLERNYLFRQAMDVATHTIEQFNQKQMDMRGVTLRGKDVNYFELELPRFGARGTQMSKMSMSGFESGPLRINLTGGEGALIRSVTSPDGEGAGKYSNLAVEQKKQLYLLIDHIEKLTESNSGFKGFDIKKNIFGKDAEKYIEGNTPYVIAGDILEQLRQMREVDPNIGYLTRPQTQTVTGVPDIFTAIKNKIDPKNVVSQSTNAIKNHQAGSIIDIRGISRNEPELNRVSKDIVTNILMDKLNIDKFRAMGYTDEQLNWIVRTREVRERDYQSMVKELLKGVSATDMALHLDRGTGLFAIQDDRRMIDLSAVPRERIVDGNIYTQVGRDRIAIDMGIGVNVSKNATEVTGSQVTFQSAIKRAMDNAFKLEASVVNQNKRGIDPINTIQSYITKIASQLREGSSVERLDESDSKHLFVIDEKEFINNLSKMPGIRDVKFGFDASSLDKKNTLSPEAERKFFLDFIERSDFSYEKMNDSMKSIYDKYRRDIMEHVFGQMGVSNDVREIVGNLSNRLKPSLASDGKVKVGSPQYEMEIYNNPNRIFEGSAKYLGFREDVALKRLEELDMDAEGNSYLKGKVYLGANLRSLVGQSRSRREIDSLSSIVHTEAIVKRAYVDSDTFKKRVFDATINSSADDQWTSERLREIGNLYEGGAVASSRLGDVLLQSYDRQRVSSSRKLFDELQFSIEQLEEMKKYSEVAPEYKIGKNGKITFEYSKGKYYNRGSVFVSEHAYGDSIKDIASKNDGVLRQAFFTKTQGIIADEKEVRDSVIKYAMDRGLRVRDPDAFINIAEKIYDSRFYIERLTVPTYQKLHEDRVEKGMAAFAYTGLGNSVRKDETGRIIAGDGKILKALEETGLSSLKGSILEMQFFEELKTGNIDGGIIAQISDKDLTSASFAQAVKQAGYENVEDFGKAIEQERHSLSDFVSRHFDGAVYLSNTEDFKHKNVSRPVSMMVNEMYAQFVDEGITAGETQENAREFAATKLKNEVGDLFKGIGGKGLEVANGYVVTPQQDFLEGSGIRYDKLMKAYADHTKKDINDVMEKYGSVKDKKTGIGFATISLPEDYTSISGAMDLSMTKKDDALEELQKGFKITDREKIFFGLNRIHDEFIQNSFKHLDEETFNAAYGFMVEKDEAGKILLNEGRVKLKDGYDRKAYLDPFSELVDREQFAQNGDELFIRQDSGMQEIVRMRRGADGQQLKPGERIEYDTISESQLSDYERRLHVAAKGAADTTGGNVSRKAAETLYSIATNKVAIDFNRGNISESTLTGLDEFGFKGSDIKLSDISFTTGHDKRFFKDGVASSIYNKDVIIDLSEIDDNILREAEVRGNKIAVGAIPSQYIGENIMQQDVHKLLKDIQHSVGELAGRNENEYVLREHDYERNRDTIVQGLKGINDMMAGYVTKKKGALKSVSEIRMSKSAIGKASLMTLEEGMHNDLDILKNVQVDGKSILEHHRSGVLMDFNIASREFVEKMGLFEDDYIKEVLGKDGTRAQMEDILRQGVQVMAHRNPTVYEKSFGPSMLILSDNTYGNQLISYAAGSLARKEDADGDQTKIKLAEVLNEKGQKVDAIEYQLGGSKVDAKATEGFDLYKAFAYRNATEINPYYAKAIREDMETTQKVKSDAADKIIAERTINSAFIRPELTRLADNELREALYTDFLAVENRALEKYEQAGGKAADFVDDEKYRSLITKAVQEYDGESFDYYSGSNYSKSKAFAVDYYLRDMSFIASQIGSNKQAAAGEMNLPLYKARKIREIAYSRLEESGKSEKMRILDHIFEAAEEAFLSPKHNEGKIISNTMVIEEFNKAFRQATGFVKTGETAGTQALADWFDKNLPGRYKAEKPLDTIGTTIDKLSKEEQRRHHRIGADLIHEIFSQYNNIDRLNLYVGSLGQTEKGLSAHLLADAFVDTGRRDTMMDNSMAALSRAYGTLITTPVNLVSHADLLSPTATNLDDWRPPVADNLKDTTTKIFESAKNLMQDKGITGKHLAFGALGMAGATMVLGFVGGNPSERSTTTAAADQGSLYSVPMMTDEPAAMMQANPSQGYVININASSPKGQRQAEEAIRQSMVAGYNSTNVNIAMNINNNGGNITDSTIQRMIEGIVG